MSFLKNLINEDQETWVNSHVDPSFKLKIKFASRDAFMRMQKNATTFKFDRKMQDQVAEVDDDKFMAEFINECVKDWEGFTLRVASKMVLLDLSQFTEEEKDAPTPFSHEDAVDLIKHDTTNLGTWLIEAVRDIENFTNSK